MAILSGILTGIIPLLTKAAEALISSRKEDSEREFELQKLKIELEARGKAGVEEAKYAAMKADAEAEKYRYKTIQQQSKPSGIKKIDAAINLVRAVFGYGAAGIFLCSAVNLWLAGSPILDQGQFAEAFFCVLFYFFAERSAKKAFGKD